jgi:beta-glucosidase
MTVKEQAIGKTTETADGSTTLQMIDKGEHTYSISEILNAAKQAETIIFVGGISPNLEREEAKTCAPGFDRGDRTSIELPQVQRDILSALHKAGKKIVFVNCSGSAVALAPEMETCDAIVQAWYAGEQGGHALADVLFGDYNPSGKLAVTFYRDDSQLPPFKDYHMKGRTYRYFRGQPLFPFGFGLSYTTFSMDKEQCKKNKDGAFEVSVNVRNTGNREGTEVVQLYLRRPADVEGPAKTLRGYQRVSLKAGESKTVTITLPREDFEVWDATSNTMRVIPGDYQLMIGSSSDDKDLRKINVTL